MSAYMEPGGQSAAAYPIAVASMSQPLQVACMQRISAGNLGGMCSRRGAGILDVQVNCLVGTHWLLQCCEPVPVSVPEGLAGTPA